MIDNWYTCWIFQDFSSFLSPAKPIITSPAYNNGDHHKLSIGLNDPSSLDLEYYSNAGDTTVTVENGEQVVVVGAPLSIHVQLPVFTQTVSASGMTVTLNVDIKNQNQFRRYEIVLQNVVNSVKFSLVVAPKRKLCFLDTFKFRLNAALDHGLIFRRNKNCIHNLLLYFLTTY